MGKIPNELRETIARNIRECRMKKFPGRGGGKKCAESFGVSPQQWSPWERGMRTPDELRLSQIAEFFDVTVEYLRRDNSARFAEPKNEPSPYYYKDYTQPPTPALREREPPYGLPPLRRNDNLVSGSNVADLAVLTARLLGMIGTTTKGVAEGKFDIENAIAVIRRLGDMLEHKLLEAELHTGMPTQQF